MKIELVDNQVGGGGGGEGRNCNLSGVTFFLDYNLKEVVFNPLTPKGSPFDE